MIYLVDSSLRESDVFAELCRRHSWPCQLCRTLAAFENMAERHPPEVVVVRSRLIDAHADSVISIARRNDSRDAVRVIVLDSAASTATSEARYIELGADCVLRDPIRPEVLIAYLAKYHARVSARARIGSRSFAFGSAKVFPQERLLSYRDRQVNVSPREVDLLRLLSRTPEQVVPYSKIYADLFCRRFEGDTANARVLLGKIARSFGRLSLNIRSYISVIPKSGYLYSPQRSRRDGSASPRA